MKIAFSSRVNALGYAFTACLLVLGGCGFQPLHGPSLSGVAVSAELAQTAVAPIPNREGQILRNNLLDRLKSGGASAPTRFTLRVRLDEPRQTLALRRDDIISRIGYSAAATFELIDSSGRPVFRGNSSFSTDYEVTSSEFATMMSAQAARERVLELVSDDIRNQLAMHFNRR